MTHNDVINVLVKLYPSIKDEPEYNYDITKLWVYVINKFAGQELFKQSEEFSGNIRRSSNGEIVISCYLSNDEYYTTMITIANKMLLLKKLELLQENYE